MGQRIATLCGRLTIVACAVTLLTCGVTWADVVFCCQADNDLFKLMASSPRFDSPAETIAQAADGSGVLLLADGYPKTRTPVSDDLLARAKAKRLRLYVEYPSMLPQLKLGETRSAVWERGVVTSDAFGDKLVKLRIVAPHDCRWIPIDPAPESTLLEISRVAGFDSAVFGLGKDHAPLLFETPEGHLIATTKLSDFVTARFAPADDWRLIWRTILKKLDPAHDPPALDFTPIVRPALGRDDPAPSDLERSTLDRASKFYLHARLLITPQRRDEIHRLLRAGIEGADLPATDEEGDGTLGIIEGYASQIRFDGSQPQRTPIRSDCNAEAAMVLALAAGIPTPSPRYSGERVGERGRLRVDANPRSHASTRTSPLSPTLSPQTTRGEGVSRDPATVASNLLDYTFSPEMESMGRSDPKHPAFGLIAWGAISPAWMIGNYGDDDARVILSTIAASAALKSDRWDINIARALLSNLRTTGKHGFRGDRVDIGPLEQSGWRHFHDAGTINPAPHFESYLWACYLWAYARTGEREFLDKTTTAIRLTMDAYAKTQWRWMDNIERARMLLCLSWLVRVEDTPEHRAWLMTIATDLLDAQQPCGAIQERRRGNGDAFQIPQSNEAYGTSETPLIQNVGDPASDQLYTTGFALLALHEAVGATGDANRKQAEDKLADFLCRIQIRSEQLPYLDGGWFRAFDYRRWDYWSSSADLGWGAWSVEAGWAQAWTAATLALRERKTTFWEFTAGSQVKNQFDRARTELSQNSGEPWKK